MNRALWLLPVPVVAIVAAGFAFRSEAPAPHAATASPKALPAAATPGPTWVTTQAMRPAPRLDLPAVPGKAATGPKPATDSRTALSDSHMPVVASLSIDRLGSPRERLLAAKRGTTEARQAQLDHLSGRAEAHIARLEAERALATGPQRTRLDETITKLKKNESYRARVITATVHSPMRPGAAAASPIAAGAMTPTPAAAKR